MRFRFEERHDLGEGSCEAAKSEEESVIYILPPQELGPVRHIMSAVPNTG